MTTYKIKNRFLAISFIILLLLAFSCLSLLSQEGQTSDVKSPPAWDKTEIQIAVISALDLSPYADEIAIKMVGYHDEKLLEGIALKIAEQFRSKPANFSLATENADFEDDNSYQLKFNLPIVPRGQEYLPIEPFLVASAPYAKKIRIVYCIIGNFNYRGYSSNYKDKYISFSVDLPKKLGGAYSFYGIEADIKNKDFTELNIPIYEPKAKNITKIIVAISIGLIIIALGVILAIFLSSKQEKEKQKNADKEEKTNL